MSTPIPSNISRQQALALLVNKWPGGPTEQVVDEVAAALDAAYTDGYEACLTVERLQKMGLAKGLSSLFKS